MSFEEQPIIDQSDLNIFGPLFNFLSHYFLTSRQCLVGISHLFITFLRVFCREGTSVDGHWLCQLINDLFQGRLNLPP